MKHPDALRIALVGIGKIARDQHVPTIAARDDVQLVATVSRHGTVDGVPAFQTLEEAFSAHPQIEAVALCTPPVGRHALAQSALAAGRHVFLEKPPAATLAEIDDLRVIARQAQRSLFTSWHSRCAAGVEPARQWLAGKQLVRVHITWKEDIRHWHPGQDWILEPGGMGVFDPGINALSIVTHLLPRPFALRKATLHTPSNRQAPLAYAYLRRYRRRTGDCGIRFPADRPPMLGHRGGDHAGSAGAERGRCQAAHRWRRTQRACGQRIRRAVRAFRATGARGRVRGGHHALRACG